VLSGCGLFGGSKAKEHPAQQTANIGTGITATATTLQPGMHAADAPGIKDPIAAIAKPVLAHPVNLTPSGPLPAPTTLVLPVNGKVPAGAKLVALIKEDTDTQWTALDATLSSDGTQVTVVVPHFSNLIVDWIDTAAKATTTWFTNQMEDLVQQMGDAATGDLTRQTVEPECDGASEAKKDDYHIQLSDPEDTLNHCLGMRTTGGKQERILKVINRTHFPIQLAWTNLSLNAKDLGKTGMDLSALAQSGTLQHLLYPKGNSTVLLPGEQAILTVADLKENTFAKVTTKLSGGAESLYLLNVAVSALIAILLKLKIGVPSAEVANLQKSAGLKTMDQLLSFKDCSAAVLQINLGAVIRNCLNEEQLKLIAGAAAAWLSPIAVVGAVAESMVSAFETLVKQFTGRDKAAVSVVRQDPNPFKGVWKEGSSTLTFSSDGKTATRHWVRNAFNTCQCNGDAVLGVVKHGTTATLTYRKVTYTLPDGEIYPGDLGDDATLETDSETLTVQDTGLVRRTYHFAEYPVRGVGIAYNHYLCQVGSSNAHNSKCVIGSKEY
jgi:hypothetical protein